ncbi:hypothetical protein ACFVWN_01410 [Nocardiopsis flavescens]|uniref:hypothetical protein n=1 Tax=Nocardiopsis flavescens TaxID=758803 RepID=UPI0036642C85
MTIRISRHNEVRAFRRACTAAGLRLEASQGTYTVHRLGHRITVGYRDGRWELGPCPLTQTAAVSVPASSPARLLPDLTDRLDAMSAIRHRAA